MNVFRKFIRGIILKPEASDPSETDEGQLSVNSTTNQFKIYLNGALREILTSDSLPPDPVTNKRFDDSTVWFVDTADNTKAVKFDASGTTGTSTTIAAAQTADRTITLPDADDTLVGKATTDVLTNKSIDADTNTLTNISNDEIKVGADIDRTKLDAGSADHVVINDASGVMSSEAQLAKVRGGSGQDNSSLNFPASGTLATLDGVETFTNKTFDDALTIAEIATPANPAVGYDKIYFKADGNIYRLDSTGNERGLGSGGGAVRVTLYDPSSTALPAGPTATIDGVAVANDDLVLFSNLLVNNNRVYKASGVGVALVWTAQSVFASGIDISLAESIIVQEGTAFALQTGIFDGSDFTFNDVVRYFSDTDYWEQTSLKTATLTDNSAGNIFSVNITGSENIIVKYSILRGSTKEAGAIYITSDGTDVAITRHHSYIGSTGIEFSASITLGVLDLDYTSTNTGDSGTMKYHLERWSDSAGGPGGPPNYTVVTPSTSNGPLTILDNNGSPVVLLTLPVADYPHIVMEYSIDRDGEARTGRVLIASNGSSAAFSDDSVETASLGIVLSADVSGADVRILYTSTSTGFDGTFKYIIRSWS